MTINCLNEQYYANAGIWLILRYFYLKQVFKQSTTSSNKVPDVSGMTLDVLTEQYYSKQGNSQIY
jgi:hypothetical protein